MRRRISTRRRTVVIGISIAVFLVILVFVVDKMTSLTKNLKEDFSRAGIICNDISTFSSAEISDIISSGQLDGVAVSNELAEKIMSKESEICIVELEYMMYFNTDTKIDDISLEIKNSEISDGEVYAFSAATLKEKTDTAYRLGQTVLMDKSCLRESIFEKTLPCSFAGQFDYKFSYFVEGRETPDTIAFSTAKKV